MSLPSTPNSPTSTTTAAVPATVVTEQESIRSADLLRTLPPARAVSFWLPAWLLFLVTCGIGLQVAVILGPLYQEGFEGIGGWVYWTAPWFVIAGSSAVIGVTRHRSTGDAVSAPALVVWGSTLTLYIVFCSLAAEWAADWSTLWAATCLLLIVALSAGLTLSAIACRGSWRVANASVVRHVWNCLQSGSGWIPKTSRWGSQHLLRILSTAFREAVVESLAWHDDAPNETAFERVERRGTILETYLDNRWAPSQLAPDVSRRLRIQTAMELLTVRVLYCQTTSEDSSSVDRVWRQLPAAVAKFEKLTNVREADSGFEPVVAIYRLLIEIHEKARESAGNSKTDFVVVPLADEKRFVRRFCQIAMQSAGARAEVCGVPASVLCRRLWVSLTPGIRLQGRFDNWWCVDEELPEPDAVSPLGNASSGDRLSDSDNATDLDIVECLAVQAFMRDYSDWAETIEETSRQSMQRKAERLAGEFERIQDAVRKQTGRDRTDAGALTEPPAGLLTATQQTATWPYREVWRTWTVQTQVLTAWGLLALLPVLTVVRSHPGLNFGFWNSPDFVADVRPGHDYTARTTTAAAVSGDAVAQGTDDGMTILRIHGRGPRELVTTTRVADVSPGPVPGTFLTLDALQGLDSVDARTPQVSARTWLQQPAHPVWDGASAGASQPVPVAARQDVDGVLVALAGLGIGRSRNRNWTETRLIPGLSDALIGKDRIWTVAPAGTGTGSVVQSHQLDSLAPDATTKRPVGLLSFIDVDHQNDAVSVIEDDGRLHLFDPERKTWYGLFRHESDQPRLLSAGNVFRARWFSPMAVLAASNGLYAYDLLHRRMTNLMSDVPVIDLLAVEDSQTGRRILMLPTSRGMRRVIWTPKGGFSDIETVDDDAVLAADMTESGSRCGWLVVGGDVRIQTPSDDDIQTILKSRGWDRGVASLKQKIQISDIEQRNDDYTIATPGSGAFQYRVANPAYTDASIGLFQKPDAEDATKLKKLERPLQDFEMIERGDRATVTIADGLPFIRDREEARWMALDDTQRGDLKSIVNYGPQDGQTYVAVTDETHVLRRYGATRPRIQQPRVFCLGESSDLVPSAESTFIGDVLSRASNVFDLSFVTDGSIVDYQSDEAQLTKSSLSNQGIGTKDDIRQLLLGAGVPGYGRHTFVTGDGRLVSSGGISFGAGSFPFSPESATAISESSIHTALVAGPEGQVVSYDGRLGSVSRLGAIPPQPGPIVRVHAAGRTLIAETQQGKVFARRDSAEWLEHPEVIDWCAHKLTIMARTAGGLSNWLPVPGKIVQPDYAAGRGFREFFDAATFAWRTPADTLALFHSDGRHGIYDPVADTWREATERLDAPIRQFIDAGDSLLIVADGAVRRVKQDSQTEVLLSFGAKPDSVGARVIGQKLHCVWVMKNGVEYVVRDLAGDADESTSVQSRRSRAIVPYGFSADEVVFAEERGERVQLTDSTGAVAEYDPYRGQWSSTRRSVTGQTLYGTVTWENVPHTALLIDADSGSVRTRLNGGIISADRQTGLPPHQTLEQMKAVGRGSVQTAHLLDRLGSRLPWLQRRLQPAVEHLTQTAQAIEPTMKRPQNGSLLSTRVAIVRRNGGGTTYSFDPLGRQMQEFKLQGNRFDVDDVTSVTITPDARLWASVGGQLRELYKEPVRRILVPSDPARNQISGLKNLETSAIGLMTAQTVSSSSVVLEDRQADGLRVTSVPAPESVLAWTLAPWELECRLGLDGVSLNWSAGPGGRPAIWSGTESGLTSQNVRDVAIDDAGHVLVLTEMGLLIRRMTDYGPHQVLQIPTATRLTRVVRASPLGQTVRILIESDTGIEGVWENGGYRAGNAVANRHLTEARTGPWVWQVDQTGLRSTLTIRHHRSVRNRGVEEIANGGWRFKDDIVNWIVRDPGGPGRLWLATNDGIWPLSARGKEHDAAELRRSDKVLRIRDYAGRGPWWWQDTVGDWHALDRPGAPVADLAAIAAIPTGPERTAGHAAMQVTALDGQLSLLPFDGRTPFLNGSFFFDQIDDLAVLRTRLYSRTLERGVFQRHSEFCGRITAAWPDAPRVNATGSDTRRFESDHDKGVLRVVNAESDKELFDRWEVEPSLPPIKAWTRHIEPLWNPPAQFGPIAFLPDESRPDTLVPYRVARFGEAPPVPGQPDQPTIREQIHDYWSDGRFQWDDLHDVALLSDESLIAACPLGVVHFRKDAQGSYRLDGLHPVPGLRPHRIALSPARTADRRTGIIVTNSESGIQSLLKLNADGRPSLERLDTTHSFDRRARVTIDDPDPQNATGSLRFSEAWVERDQGTAFHSLESRLAAVRTAELIVDGQFVFDWCRCAAPEDLTRGAWITAAPVTETSSLLVLNRLPEETEPGLPVAHVRGLWRLNGQPTHLRKLDSGEVCYVTKDQAHIGRPVNGQPLLTRIRKRNEVADRFQVGHQLTLKTRPLSWTRYVQPTWDRMASRRPVIIPDGMDLFADSTVGSRSGLAFSFDVFTSLAVSRSAGTAETTPQIAIGTHAGVLTAPYQARSKSVLAQAHLDVSTTDGRRVRVGDANGFQLVSVDTPDIPARDMSLLQFGSKGLRIRGSAYSRSRDPFPMTSRSLDDLIAAGRTSDGVLWLITRSNGIFRMPL